MTALAGVFFGVLLRQSFPEQLFSISRSIEIILGPIIGGIGTLFGPSWAQRSRPPRRRHERNRRCLRLGGAGHQAVDSTASCFFRHRLLPHGIWPSCARSKVRDEFSVECTKAQRILSRPARGHKRLLRSRRGAIVALIGPNGAGKTTIFNMVAGVLRPDDGEILFAGKPSTGCAPDQICALGIGRTFQIVKPFAGLSVLDNVDCRRAPVLPRESTPKREHSLRRLSTNSVSSKRDFPASSLTLPDRKDSKSRALSPPGRNSCSSTK